MKTTLTKMFFAIFVFSVAGTWGWVKLIQIAARNDAENKQRERELLAKEIAKALRGDETDPATGAVELRWREKK